MADGENLRPQQGVADFLLWPRRLTGYLDVLITSTGGLLLTWMLADYLFDEHASYTPLAIVVVANTFLIGIVLMAMVATLSTSGMVLGPSDCLWAVRLC